MEIPIEMDDLGFPPFSEAPMWILTHRIHGTNVNRFTDLREWLILMGSM